MCLVDGQPAALFFLSVPELRHLSAYVVALMRAPRDATPALALYMRHAFWSLPLHRLYTHVPVLPSATPYADTFVATGFKNEGFLKGHISAGDTTADAMVLGLLRDEFALWCAERDPRLVLP
jgi:hypothetical protein